MQDMNGTGIIRKVDDLGRIMLPKEVRRKVGIKEGTPMEITVSDDGILLQNIIRNNERRSVMKRIYTVTMSNGDVYGIPAEFIAENRAGFYQECGGDDGNSKELMMEWFDAHDHKFAEWAKQNMDWDDVKDKAILMGKADIVVDFQDGWVNGDYGFVQKK